MDFAVQVTTIVVNIATTLGIVVAASYFFVRVTYQKTFQRLSADLAIVPITAERENRCLLDLKLTNNADARIDLKRLDVDVFVDGQLLTTKDDFSPNVFHDNGRSSYSIDAQSTTHFYQSITVPQDANTIKIVATFSPKLTSETYRVEHAFALGLDRGERTAETITKNMGIGEPADARETSAASVMKSASTPRSP